MSLIIEQLTSVRVDDPVWSPGGRWILFDRTKPEGGDIWLMERTR